MVAFWRVWRHRRGAVSRFGSVTEFTTLTLDCGGPIARLTLNRPDRLNALSPQALVELVEAARVLADSEEVKVVVLGGAGRAFSAGFDLNSLDGEPSADRVDPRSVRHRASSGRSEEHT